MKSAGESYAPPATAVREDDQPGQGNLFSDAPRVRSSSAPIANRGPIARRNGPITSLLAAQELTVSGARSEKKRKLLDFLRTQIDPMTSFEIAMALGWDRHETAKRLPDLRADALVENGPMRRCRVTNRWSLTWRVVRLAVFTLWNIDVGSLNPFFYAYFARELHLSTNQIGFHLLGLPNGRTRGSRGGATHHSANRRRIRHRAHAGRDRGFHGPARNRTLRPIRRRRLRDVRIVSVHERAGNLHPADVSRHAWRARGSIFSQLLRHVRRHPLRDRAVLIFAAFSTALPAILFRMLR